MNPIAFRTDTKFCIFDSKVMCKWVLQFSYALRHEIWGGSLDSALWEIANNDFLFTFSMAFVIL